MMHVSLSTTILAVIGALPSAVNTYTLVETYDASNWFESFDYNDATDPTNGFVNYTSLAEAQSLGLTKIMNDQVYFGVDNTTILPSAVGNGDNGRKSTWLTSKKPFLHGLLIGDFAHMPGSECGLWPAFWTISNADGPYGEIDILEGYSNLHYAYTTLHTKTGTCTFDAPTYTESGTENQSGDCTGDVGCSVQGPVGGYGTSFNKAGGGVYALEWTSETINIYFFARSNIPADITAGTPTPSTWGLPIAMFASASGDCDIDSNFLTQTIFFDTTFCGAEASGKSWTTWTNPTCASITGYATCEEYVAAVPSAFDDAYWLVNSVKVYQ